MFRLSQVQHPIELSARVSRNSERQLEPRRNACRHLDFLHFLRGGGVGLFLRLRRRRLIGGDGEAVDRRGCAVDVSIRSRRGRRPSAAAVCSHCEVTDELYARGEKRETEFFPLPVFLFCLLKRRKKKDEKVRERGRGGALSKIEKQRHRALLFLRRFFSLSQRSNRHALTPCSCPIFVQTPRAR